MTRNSMNTPVYLALVMIALLGGTAGRSFGQDLSGTAIGPGVGGQVHAFAFDPEDTNTAYAGGDVCGVYKYTYSADGGSWEPWSDGLGSGDLNRSYYVDDLLVLGASDGVDDNSRGVYAATQGGLYFRGTNASTWTCLSNSFYYTGGFADNAFNDNGTHDTALRVPFSSLAFDSQNKKIYMAAGYGRITDDTEDYSTVFPAQGLCNGKANSLWVCNVGQGGERAVAAIDSTAYGNARQVTVANYPVSGGIRTEVVVASDYGIGVYKPASSAREMIWPPSDPVKARLDINTDSVDPWGVAMGSSGILYGLMSRASMPARHPGLWQFNMTTDRDTTNWVPVKGDDSLWPYAFPDTTWSYFISPERDNLSDLTELSVHQAPDGDEIFVGEGRNGHGFGQAGYFRFGLIDSGSGRKRSWAHIHRTTTNPSGGVDDVIGSGRWRAGTVVSHALSPDQKGWHSYFPLLRALAPFAVHPGHPNIMVGIDYGIPLMTRDGGATWFNLYCEAATAGGWSTRGLNLMCATSCAFLSDGRLVAGALDYGAFCANDAGNTAFVPLHDPLHASPPFWPKASDIEVVSSDAGQEIYMIDNQPGKYAKIWAWPVSLSTASWDSATTNLRSTISVSGPMEISDLEFAGPDTVFAAVGMPVSSWERHYYICMGTRPSGSGTNSWAWRNALSLGTEGLSTKIVNKLRIIPGTHRLLYSAKYTNGNGGASDGGIFCVSDYTAATWNVSPWLAGGADASSALAKLGRNVTSIAVDEAGFYAYAGCSGHDSPWTPGRGGVIRFAIANGAPADTTILAGGDDQATSDRFGLGTITNFPGGSNPAAWEYCTHVSDIRVDPHNPRVIYAAVDNGSYLDDDLGAWCCRDTAWTQVWGNPEAGSGAATIGITPSHPGKLYVGTRAQEFFAADIDTFAHPAVAAQAAYPILAGVGGPVHAFGVKILPPPGAVIDSAVVYLASIGGKKTSVRLYDDGVAPDLESGDAIFTSRRFAATPAGPGVCAVTVRAHDSNGCYDLQDVNVTVVASATAPVITPQAVYPMRAGSTDTSRVLAVEVSTPAATTRVTANIAGLGGTSSVRLRDDGKGEDIKKGDGIFTSAPFAAGMADSGSYFAAVSAEPLAGAAVTQSVNMLAVANAAKFANVSDSSTVLRDVLNEAPYAVTYFKSEPGVAESADLMVVTFDNGPNDPKTPAILQWTRNESGVPQFENMTNDWFGTSPPLAGSRGVCYADFDNDGDNDLFICNPYYGGRLYRNDGAAGFENVTDTVFVGADRDAISQAIAASWGDYNGDGFVDLFVANTNYYGSVRQLATSTTAAQLAEVTYATCVFRNVKGAALKKNLLAGSSGTQNLCLSGCWVDLDNDGDLDLVTTKLIGGAVVCMENAGFLESWGDNVFPSTFMTLPGTDPDRFYGANSVSVIDYDHNDFPDLLVTYATYFAQPKTKILHNDCQTGARTFTPVDVQVGTEWSGATVGDFDLNGQEDILLLPRNADVPPGLLMAEYSESTPDYRDLGHTLGLRHGVTSGGLATDFDGDGNIDILLGRAGVGQAGPAKFLYRNDGQAAGTASANWVGVRLKSLGNSNRSLIGARVIVTAAGKRWTKWVEGGSGRGGQGANELRFGLGGNVIDTKIRVEYPAGGAVEKSGSDVQLNQYNEFTETAGVVIANTAAPSPSPTCTFDLGPGIADFVFKWRTVGNKGDMRADAVTVGNKGVFTVGGACDVGIAAGDTHTIEWGDTDADFLIYKVGNDWQHVVRWRGLPCGTNCFFKYTVTSGVGSAVTQFPSSPPWRTTTTPTFCVPGETPVEQ